MENEIRSEIERWAANGWTIAPFKTNLAGLDSWASIDRIPVSELEDRFQKKYGQPPEVWGLLGGKQINNNGHYSLIIDADAAGAFEALAAKLPKTRIHKGSKLGHFILKTDAPSPSFAYNTKEGLRAVDIIGDGKMAVLPPSPHRKTGLPYSVIEDIEPAFIPLGDAFQIIENVAKEQSWQTNKKAKEPAVDRSEGVFAKVKERASLFDFGLKTGLQSCPLSGHRSGDRHPSLSVRHDGKVFNCFSQHGGGDVIRWLELSENLKPLEAAKKLAERYGISVDVWQPKAAIIEPSEYSPEELNKLFLLREKEKAKELIAKQILKRNIIITTRESDEMFVYDGGIYRQNADTIVKESVSNMLKEAGCGSKLSLNMAAEVEFYARLSTYVNSNVFDVNPELICLENGILNIKTKEFIPHSPSYYFLNKIPVRYDPAADCPKIKRFLKEVLGSDKDADSFFELAGYLLYRRYPFHKAFMLTGSGSNGKSTTINLLRSFIGINNAINLSLQEICDSQFSIAELRGKLACFYADLPARGLRETGRFKVLTGEDTISAEMKFKQKRISFQNTAKMLFSCNQIPYSPDDTDAYHRRWINLHFPNSFEKTANPNILKELTEPEELSGLLNEAIAGLNRLIANGRFSSDKPTSELREDYIRKSDSIGAFALDLIEIDSTNKEDKAEVYRAYLGYCKERKYIPVSDRVFYKRLASHVEFKEGREFGSGRKVIGFKLKKDVKASEPEEQAKLDI